MALVCKPFGDIITFTRASGATWFNSAGNLIGVDFSTSSNTIGTGSKTFTLNATAGVDRSWATGDTVLIVDQANSANNMTGAVTSYTASTQALVVNVTSTAGSGTITSWRVGNLMQRLDYDPSTLAAQGLLIEEQRTNLLTYSEQFDNASGWTSARASVSANATTAPTGTSVADKIVEDTTASNTHLTFSADVSVSTATVYTYSVYAKAAGRTWFNMQIATGSGAYGATVPFCYFNLSGAGAVGTVANATGSITAVGNGWYRCVLVAVATTSASTTNIRIKLATGDGVETYTGDGTSGIFVFGAQLEAGAFPTSYIPTTTTALTRSADVASVNTLSPWFNASAGTLFTESQQLPGQTATVFPRIAVIDDGSTNNAILNLWRSDTSRLYAAVTTGGVTQSDVGTNGVTQTNNNKIAGAYATNDFAASVNGGSVSTDSSGTVPTGLTTLRLGRSSGTDQLNGWLRRVSYFPRRLSNAELQSLTA